MLRSIFAIMILIHAIIHVLGFIAGWNLTQVKQLSGKAVVPISENLSKVLGTAWAVALLIFVISVAGLLFKKDWWWMVAIPGVVISQTLIVFYWPDAKAGTIINIIVSVVIISAYADWRFSNKVEKEVKSLLKDYGRQRSLTTKEMLSGLPSPVQKWLERSNVIGKETIESVRLKQKGEMRTNPDGNWMPAEAEQYFTVDKPAFIWKARIEAKKFLPIVGRDKYENGKGNMLIKFLALIPIVDARGKEIDQGTLHRYLSETVWFPTAALSSYITWKEISDSSAQATMTYCGITASGIFSFSNHGDVISFESQRYREINGDYSLDTWFISIPDKVYKEFNGIRVPGKAEVTWKLKEGDFTYYKLNVTDLEYNNPSMY